MKVIWVILSVSGCATREWRATVREGTSEAYSAYASANPGTMYAAVAERRAEQRAWIEADFANSSTAYAAFVAAFPTSEHAPEARARAEKLGWEEAVAERTIPALTAFVSRYPESPHAAVANGMIEEMWYEEARRDGTETAWSRYIVRYPQGAHVAEAESERERLVWAATTAAGTRLAYQRYIERFPHGPHVGEARNWVAATYVSTLQPLIVLVGSWQGPGAHTTVMGRLRKEFDATFVPELRRDFVVLPTRTLDVGPSWPHPQDELGVQPDVGILVLEYSERQGRKFDPSGNATDITAVLRLYVPNSRNAVFARELDATTPERVRGNDLSALNTEAMVALVEQMRLLADEVAKNKRGTQ